MILRIKKGDIPIITYNFEKLKRISKEMEVLTSEGIKRKKIAKVFLNELYYSFSPKTQRREKKEKYLGQYYVDSVTGSIYEPNTGRCLTSSQLKLIV